MKIIIVDYGMGNVYSLKSAINFLGYDCTYSNNSDEIINSDKLILPGVGSFKNAMNNIKSLNIDKSLKDAVSKKKIPILGICLGMQLLGISSKEDGFTNGLNLFPGTIEKFKKSSLKVPHVGFNSVQFPSKNILYNGIPENADYYFVHSFKMDTNEKNGVAYCNYGEKFVASFEFGNIYGTQFHPEKSQKNGLILLKNFIQC